MKYLIASIGLSLITSSILLLSIYILDVLFVIFKILSGFIPITEYLPLKSPSFNDSKRKLFSISSDIFMKLLTGSTKSELNFRIIN